MANSQMNGWSQDVFLINSISEKSTKFLVMSRESVYGPAAFSVTPFDDGTNVDIWKSSAVGYSLWQSLTLNRMDTFTYINDADPTGYLIISDKPVSVLSGSKTASIGQTDIYDDHMCMSLPPTSLLGGLDYYIPPITIRVDPGAYHVRVVAAIDFTVVQDMVTVTQIVQLNRGQHHEFGPVISGQPARAIRCSRPCLVAQYNMEPDYDNTQYSGPFLMWIPSMSYKTKYVRFMTPHNELDRAMRNELAIITWSAVTGDIHLNGETLTDWTEFWSGSEMAFATVVVNDGSHNISYDGAGDFGFLAWLYGDDPGDWDGYGTVIGCKHSK